MVKVKYTGDIPVHLMHDGKVWEVNPGDDNLEFETVPDLTGFVEVKERKSNKDSEKGSES